MPKTITITKEDFNNKNFPKNILKEYLEDKENTHFILMTSETDFEKLEKEYYKRKKDDEIYFSSNILKSNIT